jgi:hypothetical protein
MLIKAQTDCLWFSTIIHLAEDSPQWQALVNTDDPLGTKMCRDIFE